MVGFGGLGTFTGSLIRVPAIVIVSELIRDMGACNCAYYSLAVIVIMRLYREGLVNLVWPGLLRHNKDG